MKFDSCGMLVAAGAVGLAVLLALHNGGEFAIRPSTDADVPVLGDMKYDYQPVIAPAASGLLLQAMGWVLTKSPLGPPLRRHLLHSNKFTVLRELAAQAETTNPMLHPMRRLGREERSNYDADAAAAQQARLDPETILQRGLPEGMARHSRVMDFHNAYKSGTQTPTQAIETLLTEIAAVQDTYRPFEDYHPEEARQQAAASAARWAAGTPKSILDGVPVAIKPELDVKGYVHTAGMTYLDGAPPAEADDPVIARLRALGAVIVGTTVMPESGVTPLGYNAHWKGSFNPYNVNHFSGGSSAGSAVAVSLGLVPLALGFDGGGSVRTPAALSGVVGLTHTWGRVPFEHHAGFSVLLTGPLAATVEDAMIGYAALATSAPEGHLYSQMYGGPMPVPQLALPRPMAKVAEADPNEHRLPLDGVRIGVYEEHFADSEPGVVAACNRTLALAVSLGAEIVPIRLANLGWLRLAHTAIIGSEFATILDKPFHDGSAMEWNTRVVVGLGASLTSQELFAAMKLRRIAFDAVVSLFNEHRLDAIASPTTPMSAPVLPREARATGLSDTTASVQLLKYVFIGNLVGLPGISIPVGHDPNNKQLPIGFMLNGDHWREGSILHIARELEKAGAADASVGVRRPPGSVERHRAISGSS